MKKWQGDLQSNSIEGLFVWNKDDTSEKTPHPFLGDMSQFPGLQVCKFPSECQSMLLNLWSTDGENLHPNVNLWDE